MEAYGRVSLRLAVSRCPCVLVGPRFGLIKLAGIGFLGPVMGPIMGGFIGESTIVSWRWVEWTSLIASGLVTFPAVCFSTRDIYSDHPQVESSTTTQSHWRRSLCVYGRDPAPASY